MKKKMVGTGLIIMLAVLFVTCDLLLPEMDDGRTNVYYDIDSKTGELKAVTLYLDGATIPKTAAQRAITTDLAKMAYDFFEVVFVGPGDGTTNKVARANWELGAPAGISGVDRGTTGVNYAYLSAATTTAGTACMFVGRKDNKTLLGVGRILDVDNSVTAWDVDTGLPTTGGGTTVKADSTSVTFYIEAIKTGLLAGKYSSTGAIPNDTGDPEAVDTVSGGVVTSKNYYGIKTSSFKIDSTDTLRTSPASDFDLADASVRQTFGGVDYPVYSIPSKSDFDAATDTKSYATYSFGGAAASAALTGAIKISAPLKDSIIQKRFPRYNDNGRYFQTKSAIDSDTTVKLAGTYPTTNTAGANFAPDVKLVFDTKGSGMFSFYLEIPVYMLTDAVTTAGIVNENVPVGSKGISWRIRTGIGAELYCLDSGKSAGGCVLIKIGSATGGDWLDINWEWLP